MEPVARVAESCLSAMSLLGQQITVHKQDADGRPVFSWQGAVIAQDSAQITIEASFNREAVDLGFYTMERGDLFRETYGFERWWNVFAVCSPGGRLRGWYCNITRPPRLVGHDLYYDDLALDVLVAPDGRLRIDDEDEFQALHLDRRDPEAYRQALAALAELQALAENRRPPFAPVNSGV